MLSLLIPLHNWNATQLVQQLYLQLADTQMPFEIIIADDASDKSYQTFYESLQGYPFVQIIRSEKNMGRAAIRNFLFSRAQYPYLLFIDCDAGIYSDHFISQYINFILQHERTPLYAVSGGVAYRDEKPPKNQYLRWYYGRRREELPAKKRKQQPYRSFTLFNLLLSKQIFEKITFDSQFTSYGNEDTFFGMQLEKLQIPVYHIDNPLYHDGLDENDVYLQKIESSIQNLSRLLKEKKVNDSFIKNYRLLYLYTILKQLRLLPFFTVFYRLFAPYLKKKLLHSPKIWQIDMFKLGNLVQIKSLCCNDINED